MSSTINSYVVPINFLLLELTFINSSSLYTSSCDFRITTTSPYNSATISETDYSGFVIFPNDKVGYTLYGPANWEVGVDGLFCRGTTTI